MKRLELGCGEDKYEDAIGVDRIKTKETDVIHDLDIFPWPFEDEEFDWVRAQDVFEHVEEPVKFVEEIHRISKNNAIIIIRSPHLASKNWVDPTHRRMVGWNTFDYFFTEEGQSNFYSEARFRVLQKSITFHKRKRLIWNHIIEFFANKFPIFYENSFLGGLFPSKNIEIKLKVVK